MKFLNTQLAGVFEIDIDAISDERGFFARAFCADEFAAQGLETQYIQTSLSFNEKKGTLRGLHFQTVPYAETKIVRCMAGSIFDVVVDIRPNSPTRGKWQSFTLSAENKKSLYIPAGFAHGFQSLAPSTEVFYMISQKYSPEHARTLLWKDAELAINWPLANPIISQKDSAGTPLASFLKV